MNFVLAISNQIKYVYSNVRQQYNILLYCIAYITLDTDHYITVTSN